MSATIKLLATVVLGTLHLVSTKLDALTVWVTFPTVKSATTKQFASLAN